ncbi:hypothetical protein [Ferviditalea candida]|uniref:Uncharacterized protein n=1 Tax=Ferviditalea candida TaxID=3108399 RepID=A0ABU5ZDU5_9BACL|nr:hypothetical protein [Paenibacillaceae bacterium T2]
MPFVLVHRKTSEIYACRLINNYDLEYYGTKFWPDQDSAVQEAHAFLAFRGIESPHEWKIAELDEHRLKMCNVKLSNDPSKKLFLGVEGQISAIRFENR